MAGEIPRVGDPHADALAFARWAEPFQATVVLVAAVTLARVFYALLLNPYPLIEDEAHYWEWARRLDWSYYSKGPGIAALIRAGVEVFGHTEGAVRIGSALASGVTAMSVAGLAREAFRRSALRGRAAFFSACACFLTPAFQVTALLGTIDGPYVASWAAASWAALRAFRTNAIRVWLGFGLAVAIGFTFKYTVLLLIPGVVLFGLVHRRTRRRLRDRPFGLVLGLMTCLLGLVPVLVWNAQNDWATVRHLLGHLGVEGGDQPSSGEPYRVVQTLEYVGVQLAVLGATSGMIAAALVGMVRHRRPQNPNYRGQLFCVCCAGPILVFYFVVSFFTEPEANWPIAGYVTLLSMAGYTLVNGMVIYRGRVALWRELPRPRPRAGFFRKQPETFRQAAWTAMLVSGIVTGVGLLRIDLVADGVNGALGTEISLGRLTSARAMAQDAAALGDRVAAEAGLDGPPLFIAQHYGRASLLAFYLPGRPTVYCASAFTGGRRSQYDVWAETDLADPGLAGRTAVLSGAKQWQWAEAFDEVEPVGPLERDHKKRAVFVGRGFRGFAADGAKP
ncbi:MAG: glycosyltransferase family 39 protein [Planctomycetota bacterium]